MEASREISSDVNSSTKKAIRAGESAINERMHDLQDRAKDAYSTVQERARDAYSELQVRAREAADTSEEFVKEHPFTTVLGAAAVGFFAGILINRNRH